MVTTHKSHNQDLQAYEILNQIAYFITKNVCNWFMKQAMNPKGENLGTCGLLGIKGSPAEPFEMDLNFDA